MHRRCQSVLMATLVWAATFSSAMSGDEMSLRLGLGSDAAQIVHEYYRRYGFEKGCFGDVTTELLPVSWAVDGKMLYLICTPEDRSRDGANWRLIEVASDGSVAEALSRCRDGRCVNGCKFQLFAIGDSQQKRCLMSVEWSGHEVRRGQKVKKVRYYRFLAFRDGMVKRLVDGGFAELLKDCQVEQVLRTIPAMFAGAEASMVKMSPVIQAEERLRAPPLNLDEMQQLAEQYRKDESGRDAAKDETVLVASWQGCEWAYVTSKSEEVGKNVYKWRLYRCVDGQFRRSSVDEKTRGEVGDIVLPAETNCDAKAFWMVLDSKGSRLLLTMPRDQERADGKWVYQWLETCLSSPDQAFQGMVRLSCKEL